jgi:hypothetical protein
VRLLISSCWVWQALFFFGCPRQFVYCLLSHMFVSCLLQSYEKDALLRGDMRCARHFHSFTGAYSPGWTFGLPFRGFLITYIQTNGRTPLDEWSARRRDLNLHRTTQHIDTTDKHPCPERDSNPWPSNQTATDLRLRPRGHWDRQMHKTPTNNFNRPHLKTA